MKKYVNELKIKKVWKQVRNQKSMEKVKDGAQGL